VVFKEGANVKAAFDIHFTTVGYNWNCRCARNEIVWGSGGIRPFVLNHDT
jgi:hypothetical protein